MRVMSANDDHRERARKLLAAISADPQHGDHRLTAMAAVAEAVLAVADELHLAREHLTVRLLPPEPPARPGTNYVEGTTPPPEGTDAYEGRVRRAQGPGTA